MFDVKHRERIAEPARQLDTVDADSSEVRGVDEFVIATLELLCAGNGATIGLQSTLFDLNVDSLVLVSLIARAEASYRVQLAADDAAHLLVAQNVGELTDALAGIVARRRPRAP